METLHGKKPECNDVPCDNVFIFFQHCAWPYSHFGENPKCLNNVFKQKSKRYPFLFSHTVLDTKPVLQATLMLVLSCVVI